MDNRWKGKEKESKKPSRWEVRDEQKEKEANAYEVFANLLIDKIKEVKGNWKKPWFTNSQMSWPKSIYGKPYHGVNALMLSFLCEKEGYSLPVFCTGKRLKDFNYQAGENGSRVPATDADGKKLPLAHINKGETGFPVFIYVPVVIHKETKEHIKIEEYDQLSDEEKKEYDVYTNKKVYRVFNVDQTNLKEVRPEFYQKLQNENKPQEKEYDGETFTFDPLDIIINDSEKYWICPIKLMYQDGAYFSPSRNEITLPFKKQFIQLGNGESFYGTAFHEMAHSTGLKERLARLDYATEELVAETSAAMVCHRYGMDKYVKEDSVKYLSGWLKNLKENPEFIRTLLKDVKDATTLIFSRVEAARAVYLKKEPLLDGRTEDDESVEMDSEAVSVEGEPAALLADKKQGEEEGTTESARVSRETLEKLRFSR